MPSAVVQIRKSFRQDLRYYLPRWMAVLVAMTLIPDLILYPRAGRRIWYIAGLILIALVEGTCGARHAA